MGRVTINWHGGWLQARHQGVGRMWGQQGERQEQEISQPILSAWLASRPQIIKHYKTFRSWGIRHSRDGAQRLSGAWQRADTCSDQPDRVPPPYVTGQGSQGRHKVIFQGQGKTQRGYPLQIHAAICRYWNSLTSSRDFAVCLSTIERLRNILSGWTSWNKTWVVRALQQQDTAQNSHGSMSVEHRRKVPCGGRAEGTDVHRGFLTITPPN